MSSSVPWAAGFAGTCLAVRPPCPGVCDVCCGGADPRQVLCSSCREVARSLGGGLQSVFPISLAPDDSAIYATLVQYKGHRARAARRQQLHLAGLISLFLGRHSSCVAPSGWDVVGVVPSLRRRSGHHPLAETLRIVDQTRDGVADLLRPGPASGHVGRNVGAREAFVGDGCLVGAKRVLLVDDTYTTGARLQSAVFALRDAGAASVRAVVVGRHLNREWPTAPPLLAWASRPTNAWSPDRCVRCTAPGAASGP